MKWQIPLLAFYSLVILAIEFMNGQDYVRHYVTDLDDAGLFYGLNTTICTILLVLTAYNFYLSYSAKEESVGNGMLNFDLFYAAQALIFLYLAADERFMLHERIGRVLGVSDNLPLLIVGLVEVGLLYKFQQLKWKNGKQFKLLFVGGILFMLMMLVDNFVPPQTILRLSVEDLLKLWAIFLLFQYSSLIYKNARATV